MLGLKEGFFLLGLGPVVYAFSALLSPTAVSGGQCCLGLLSLGGVGIIVLGYYSLHKRKEKLTPEMKKGYEFGFKGLIVLSLFVIISIIYGFGIGGDIVDLARKSDATIGDLPNYTKDQAYPLFIISLISTAAFVITIIGPTILKKNDIYKIIFIIGIILLFVGAIANFSYELDVIDDMNKKYGDAEVNDEDTLEKMQTELTERINFFFTGLTAIGYILLAVPNFKTCTEYEFEEDEMDKIIDSRRKRPVTDYSSVRLPLAPYQKYQRRIVPTLSSSPQGVREKPKYRPKPMQRPSAQINLKTYAYDKPRKQMTKTRQIPLKNITETTAPLNINKICASCRRNVDSKFPFCPYCGKKI